MVDAASDFQRRSLNRGSSAVPPDTKNGIIIVRNQSGSDRDRFDVLGLSTVIITPTQNAQKFASRWALNAALPAATHTGKFAILQEPIKSNAFGLAMIVGVSPVYVTRPTGETSEIAGLKVGQTYLEAGLTGAQILWEDSGGTTPHLALVRMPAALDLTIIRMRVTSVQGDYLVCQRWTGSAWSATNENVVKPYLLRTSGTSRNGITYVYSNGFTRTATQGASNETQVIVPSYYTSGDEVFAAPVNYTGVVVATNELKLVDINADGRAWAKQ